MKNKLLTGYLTNVKAKNEDLAAAASALETAHTVGKNKKRNRNIMMNYYTMAYLLSGQRILNIGEKQFKSVDELAA